MEAGLPLVCGKVLIHVADTNGTDYPRNTFFNTALASDDWYVSNPCLKRQRLVHAHGRTNCQIVAAWAEDQNPHWVQVRHGPFTSNPRWRSAQNFTEEANTHQHVYWREHGSNALNFQQAGFERAAQEHEQAARVEAHVAVAQATALSRAEMLSRMGDLGQRAEQSILDVLSRHSIG